jgi:hypothetical protein
MGNEEKDLERLFSENIDRLLAGEEIETGAKAEKEVSEALEFARKMIAATPEPGAEFKARLQAKLLQRLAERERVKKGWLERLLPRQPVWQAAAALVLVAVIGIAVWVSNHQTTTEPVLTASIIQVEARPDKAVYGLGEAVEVEVTLKNVSAESVQIEPFPPILSFMREDSRQPVYTFHAGSDMRTLASGGETSFTVSWDQRDLSGGYAGNGSYYIELEDITYQDKQVKLELAAPVGFDILPIPRYIGEINQTLDPDLSQTVAGITVVIQHLELADRGARITAIISPAPAGDRQASDYFAYASYYLDGGWVKNAGLSAAEKTSGGMKHTWYLTEPIPRGTGELLFIVMNVGSTEGPWQFRIPLEP